MVNHLLETSHFFLRPLRDSVSLWLPRLPSSVHTSKFRIPQPLCLPLLRKHPGCGGVFFPLWNSALSFFTIHCPLPTAHSLHVRKHPGVWGYSSQIGTALTAPS